MKLLALLLLPTLSYATEVAKAFVIKIQDQTMSVSTPDKRSDLFSVLVQNESLSQQVGKFMVNGKILKLVSIKSGMSETVEVENKTQSPVVFIPISPAFQETELIFGKKAYEIPSKE